MTEAGELYTLGCAEQGQLGRVGERYIARGGHNRKGIDILLEPGRVVPKNRRTVFADVWAGSYDTVALTTDNEVLACGLNNYNQLGINKGMTFYSLVKSKGFSDALGGKAWKDISFGQHHALGLDGTGKVHSIGRVEYGRLGLGDKETEGGINDAMVPTLVRKLADKKFQRYVTTAKKQNVDLDKLSEQEIKTEITITYTCTKNFILQFYVVSMVNIYNQ